MLTCRSNNNIIRNLLERCLRLIYNDKSSSYEELLTKHGSVSTRHKNIQVLATELYKIKMDFRHKLLLKFLLVKQSHYNLRRCNDLRIPSIRTL